MKKEPLKKYCRDGMKFNFHYSLVFTFLVFIFTGYYIEFLILIGTIIIHELAHLFFCLLFRQRFLRLNLTLIGGILDVDLRIKSSFKQLIVYSAGVLVNLAIMFLSRYIPNPYYRQLLYQYNLLLLVFNLLPIFPLDGFRIIEVLISRLRDPFRAQKILIFISYLFLTATMIFFIFFTTSLAIWVIGFYLLYQNIIFTVNRNAIVLKKIVHRYHYT